MSEDQESNSGIGVLIIAGAAIALIMLGIVFATEGLPVFRRRRPVNGAVSAISALRTISSVQELYKTRHGCYGDYFNLQGVKYIDPALAGADPDHPLHRDKSGYNIDISVSAGNTDWCAFAYPGIWGKGRERNFKITGDGVIYYNDTKGDTTNFTKVLGGS